MSAIGPGDRVRCMSHAPVDGVDLARYALECGNTLPKIKGMYTVRGDAGKTGIVLVEIFNAPDYYRCIETGKIHYGEIGFPIAWFRKPETDISELYRCLDRPYLRRNETVE